jgi:osmotically-inducible protein OsmY
VLGVVDRVLVDPATTQATHFVLRQAAPWSKRVVVPVGWAVEVTPATVRLAVDRAQVRTLPEYRPDHELTAAILAALRAHPRLRRVLRGIISFAPALSHPRGEWAIRVRVAQGIVTLEGHVPAHGFGHMAAQIARRITGVRQVRDRLVADDDLQVAVAVALGRDPRTRAVQPRVRVDRGRVTLIGRASDAPTRAAAGAVAAAVPGVRGVANQLRRAL